MSNTVRRKELKKLEWLADQIATGGPGSRVADTEDARIIGLLMTGGPELPQAANAERLKAAFMERGQALRHTPAKAVVENDSRPRLRAFAAVPAMARVAVVAVIVVGLALTLGLGTAYARPGNPLYSIKRAAESTIVSAAATDQARTDAYTAYTDRRLGDLQYVVERGMSDWYYTLARDVEGGIENVGRYGRRLGPNGAQRAARRAQSETSRLEELLPIAAGGMTPRQRGEVERGLERLRLQQRQGRGGSTEGPGGPSQQGGPQDSSSPGMQNQQQGGPQQGTQPGQQDQQQQQQGTQPGQQDQQLQQQGQQQQQPQQPGQQQQQGQGQLQLLDLEPYAETRQIGPESTVDGSSVGRPASSGERQGP